MRSKRSTNKQKPPSNQQPWWLLVLVLPWTESPTINISLESHQEVHNHQNMQLLWGIEDSASSKDVPLN